MSDYNLNLRMGVDEKLRGADDINVGTISYAVDTHNLYIDALGTDQGQYRQQINAQSAEQLSKNNNTLIIDNGNLKFNDKSVLCQGDIISVESAEKLSKGDNTLIIDNDKKLKFNGNPVLCQGDITINSVESAKQLSNGEYTLIIDDNGKLELRGNNSTSIYATQDDLGVWFRGDTPPTNPKLLWIRYDGTATYGNGVLYYFNPTLLSETLTDAEVASVDNWIPMSAIYF